MRQALLAHLDATGGAGLHRHVLAAARLLRDEQQAARKAYAGPPPRG